MPQRNAPFRSSSFAISSLTTNGSGSCGSVPTWTMVPPRFAAATQDLSAAKLPDTSKQTSNCGVASASASRSARSVRSAPTSRACASGRSRMSDTVTDFAPARRAAITVRQPMVPAPVISTDLPMRSVPRWMACSATASGSANASSPSVTSPATG